MDSIMSGNDFYKTFRAHRVIMKALVQSVREEFGEPITLATLDNFKKRGRTAALWVLYLQMGFILFQFIRAERTGDYASYLECTRAMALIFAATGHINYAKASRLMLQLYDEWFVKYPDEVREFFGAGRHTVRYSESAWSGSWSDLSIEKSLMRYSKSSRGYCMAQCAMTTPWPLNNNCSLQRTQQM